MKHLGLLWLIGLVWVAPSRGRGLKPLQLTDPGNYWESPLHGGVD